MGIRFAYNLKQKPNASSVPDNGIELPGTNGKAVILIHGLTGTPNEMRFLANFINRQGFSVYCPRLAKHGSPLDILKKSKWQEFYQTVRGCYLDIRPRYSHVYAGGLSMGALLALLLADEFKEGISGVSCLSPTLFYDGWNCPWYRCFLPLAYYTPLKYWIYFKEEPPYGVKNEAIQRRIHEYYSQADIHNLQGVDQFGYPFFPVSLLHQLEKLVGHLTGRLRNICAPVQLIQAKDDDMTSVRNSEFIFERISSQQKEMVVLENCYHIITADQERSVVAQKMVEFFSHN